MIKKFINDLKAEFAGYNAKRFSKDLMAGITVTAVALPLALAFGVSSGADAAAGLITAIISGIIISLFSGAAFQISGPTGAMTAILITVVIKYQMQGVFVASLIAGIILLLFGILKLGKLISFIPMPVVTGFTSGIAIVIALGQIDNFFGTTSAGETAVQKLLSYGELGFSPDLQSVLIGIIVVLIMILWPKKLNAVVPSSLIGIIAATIVSIVFNFDVAVVGEIPKTLLPEQRLSLSGLNLDTIKGLLTPGFTIALLAMIESLLCGASAARMKNQPFDADRELVAQGIGNIIIPFFGGVPATAAIARTSVAIKSGCETRLTGVIHAIGLLISMFVLGGIMAKLPLSALAGVLMVTAWRMNEWSSIKYIFKNNFKASILKFLLTMVCTVVFDLTIAIAVGVIVAAFIYLGRSSKLTVTFSKVTNEKMHQSDADVEAIHNNSIVAYVTGPVFYGTSADFRAAFDNIESCDELILSMRAVTTVDVSGAQVIYEICESLKEKGINILFCGVNDNVYEVLTKAGITELIGENSYYFSVDKALLN